MTHALGHIRERQRKEAELRTGLEQRRDQAGGGACCVIQLGGQLLVPGQDMQAFNDRLRGPLGK